MQHPRSRRTPNGARICQDYELMSVSSRIGAIVLVAGEGTAIGLAAGAVLGAWEIRLHHDIAHGMLRLAFLRALSGIPVAAALGLLSSCLLALILSALSRWKHEARRTVTVLILGVLGLGTAAAALGPWRESLFPLAETSSVRLAGVSLVGILLLCWLLLALRGLDVAVASAMRRAPWLPLRVTFSALGLGLGVTVLTIYLATPNYLARVSAGHPPVVVVSIDTLRADRLGVFGYSRKLTPNMDRLAAEGAWFVGATAPAPWTMPSHASVFTSMLPFEHRGQWHHSPVKPSLAMLAEHFRNAGYRTAAFTGGGWVHSTIGFGQGFGLYENNKEDESGGPGPHFARAVRWIQAGDGRPFFLFLHTYECHVPYTHGEFADPSQAGRVGDSFTDLDIHLVYDGSLVLTESERRYVADLYDGDVAHADAVLGRFLADLRESGVLDTAVLVLLSDHGEELWEHVPARSPDHGHTLYEELLRVPLVVRFPGTIPAATEIRTPVSLLDVAPTILELAGLPADPQHDGHSLLPSLATGEEPEAREIWAESVKYGPDRFSVRSGSIKAIVTPFPDRVHLDVHLPVVPLEVFDLEADPLEREPLRDLGRYSSLIERITARALQKIPQFVQRDARPDLPEEMLEQLEALGYIE
jgi:arylsulfatase A-like enzyme